MNLDTLRALLDDVSAGHVPPAQALEQLRDLPFESLSTDDGEFARVDHHRALRQGFPEVIFCQGKTPEQAALIAQSLHRRGAAVLATRAAPEHFAAMQDLLPTARYNTLGRIIFAPGESAPQLPGGIGLLCAGTSDLPVAEEAAVTLEAMGAPVERLTDVGVAGLHRLLPGLEKMRKCDALICVAGMEGALPSVVAGLVDVPVIAVPTSVGYGAAFGGLAALLGMLNSCGSGVAVVNIDNGFGAATFAAAILRRKLTAEAQRRREGEE